MIYLASPYSHPDAEVRAERHRMACIAATRLIHAGRLAFSPIAHSHALVVEGQAPGDWAFWRRYDLEMLDLCKELYVLMLPGWRESVGVVAEIKHACERKMKIAYTDLWRGGEGWFVLTTTAPPPSRGE